MHDLAPIARFGGLVASDLRDVTSDPAALESSGFWAVSADFEGRLVCARFGSVRTEAVPAPVPGAWHGPAAGDWTSSLDRAGYIAGVRRIREYIAAGEVYQANLCRVLTAPLPDPDAADVDALTALLARGNPAPYAGTIRLPAHGVEIATASPELFLKRDGRTVESGPIKGTGRTEGDLLEKDHAENVMIVDLVRNDLGRVCATGSVTVPDLCVVEKHPGLVHLVSTVRGELAEGAGFGPDSSAPRSRPAPSREHPSPAPCGSSRSWRPHRAGPTAGASAGSTPTAVPPRSPSAYAPSGSTGPVPRRSSASAPGPRSPGAPIRNASGTRPNSRRPGCSL